MLVAERAVVTIHYTLTDDAGEVIDSSAGAEPLVYLQGFGNLIPGLEKALEGKGAGEKLQVKIPPAEGYGERDEKLLQNVPRRAFQGVRDIKAGMSFTADGGQRVTIIRVVGDIVTIDANHPLAGQNLNFDVEIVAVRESTQEEIDHGHVHGDGGHHH